ncbi:unnamed protein product [Brassicogethes aeneus]|uniref:Fibronectin type-III domain-containing protein n=1 Tax=Brassicogethes aeneus TaxID=1431903 RepID=A0A9P0FK52_BRAAE|nr:unnamed protein product [Brassicogethes aeneus]
MTYLTFFAFLLGSTLADVATVKNLMGEPDYRQVRLHWETEPNSVPKNGYSVRYCELQTWGAQRCRSQAVKEPETSENDVETNNEESMKNFAADVKGLRMATTYSFEIKAVKDVMERKDRAEGDDKNENIIVIPTKGFSAKATQCLPQASEIEVSTGPHFGGRIAVEGPDGERCAIDGDSNSPRDIYTLRINHTECGSQVNETTVATFVIVQENLPILTHSTRRFLVLCSYQPETLTVRAGINLPTAGRGQAQMAPVPYEEDNNASSGRKSRNHRQGRLLQKPEALVKEDGTVRRQPQQRNQIVPIFVITMLAIAGIIGILAIALKLTSRRLLEDLDNISIASEISTSSCSTVTDLDIVCENKSKISNK